MACLILQIAQRLVRPSDGKLSHTPGMRDQLADKPQDHTS